LSKYGASDVLKIAQLHHDHHFNETLFSDFKHRYANIDYFALLTDSLRDEISELMRPYNQKTKCVTIPNFLPFEGENSLIAKQKQVIAVGRLHTDKAFHRLIDAWALVTEKHPDWTLKIIGDGPLKDELEKQVSDLDIQNSVIFTGALAHDDVMREMAQSSIYAMTSISEAFPFVLLEAMYNYLPIVAYDVRVGPPALVKHNETGFLVPDGNTQAFSDALCKLMDSPEMVVEFQQAAYHFVQNFSEDAVIDLWLSLFTNN
jgi:glycosyltransferase involved in cell wall biosynthesis